MICKWYKKKQVSIESEVANPGYKSAPFKRKAFLLLPLLREAAER